jgi:hypothetical protein
VHGERQRIREKPFYPRAAKFTGRQAYTVHDDQFRLHSRRTGIAIRRGYLPGAAHQSGFEIDLQMNVL